MISQILFSLTKTQILLIVLPILAVQFALAIFCLSKLAYCNVSVKQYVIWNIFIVVVVFVGAITFMIYYFTHKTKLREKKESVIIDAPLVERGIEQREEKPEVSETENKS